MIGIKGYSQLELIHHGNKSRVFKAIQDSTGKTIALKTHAALLPSGSELAVLNKQYELVKALDIDGTPKALEIIDAGQSMAFSMEYFDFPSLRKNAADLNLTISEATHVFEQLAAILAQVHRKNLIHRDINPSNILYNRESGEVVLIDFGSALDTPMHTTKSEGQEVVEGTLPYMSPEQTGRINRPLDYRSDIYSLGISMYEIFTGQLPFAMSDPAEIIHSHIATLPESPAKVSKHVPKAISNIILKCIAKDADDRYQSAQGLLVDLQHCLSALEQTGEVHPFPVAEKDYSDRFQFPERLFGRREEFKTLLSLYNRVAKGSPAIAMVSGLSGVGKTSLVKELNQSVAADHGRITYGKFDQYNRHTPYSGLIQAFSSLIKQIISEDAASVRRWKEKILSAVESNGAVLTALIPELEMLIGPQPEAQNLPPAEARTRLMTVFSDFIQNFGSTEHPQVIFLDDLQWIDSSSLELIELFGLAEQSGASILFIGAYRSNEVPETHPLRISLGTMEKKGAKIAKLHLNPLNNAAVAEYLSAMFSQPMERIQDLSDAVYEKTEGNPLFFKTFLTSLYESGQITFDHDSLAWIWNITAIQNAPYAENVVDALRERINTLPKETKEILKFSSCAGSSFSIDFVADLSDQPRMEVAKRLKPVIAAGLINTTEIDFELYAHSQADTLEAISYNFSHDRIQQAAYALLNETERPALHLKAGRRIIAQPDDMAGETRLFDIAAHMMIAAPLLVNEKEKLSTAELILQAGTQAKLSTAFADAAEFLDFAVTLLPENIWQIQPELAIEVYFQCAESYSLCGQYEKAEELYKILEKHIERTEDQLRLCDIKVKQYHFQARFAEAVDIEFQALDLMGVIIPQDDEALMPFFGEEMGKIIAGLDGNSPETLLQNKENNDVLFTRKLELLSDLFADSYLIGRGLLCGATATLMARLSMENGNNPMAAVSYINFASTVCSIGDDYPMGYAFGKLAIELAEKYADPTTQNYIFHVFALAVNHWNNPLQTSHDYWSKAAKLALASGSPYVGYVFLQLAHVMFASGQNLQEVEAQIKRSKQFLKNAGLDAIVTLLSLIVQQPVKHLRGKTHTFESLNSDLFDTEFLLKEFKELPFFSGSLYYSMLRVACLSDKIINYDTLKEWITVIENTQQGQIMLADSFFYYALLLIDCRDAYPKDNKNQKRCQEAIDEAIRKMENWATLCPHNFGHKLALLKAENIHNFTQIAMLMDIFDESISKALEHSFIHDAALAAERAGEFWIARNKPFIAKSYIEQASIYYSRWGATAKVDHLHHKFSEYLTHHATQTIQTCVRETMTMNPLGTGSWSFSQGLDFSSVIKATQAVSKHIVMDDLAPDLLSIAIENAGASKGCLLVDSPKGMIIANCTTITTQHCDESKGVPYEKSDELSHAVINYVTRTGKTVVLDNATETEQFAGCEYIRKNTPASLCCIPIKRKESIKAILYLENNTAGIFKPERLQTLEVLASQATISMENAMIYQEMIDMNKNLESMIRQRTQELHGKNQELNQKNSELERLSTTDQLTGIFNRRRLDEELEREVNLCARYKKNVAVILFDVDNFKAVNDKYGHGVGDDVLCKVAALTSANIRKTDILGRWGGEEFLIIIPEFAQSAPQLAEKIREVLELEKHPQAGTVTASLGVTVFKEGDTPSSLVSRADAALYKAKENGRNRVEIAD